MTNPIVDFLEKRKQEKLKKLGRKTESQIKHDFRLEVWVANAASRASQLSIVTHPGKFSHPDAKISPVLFTGKCADDGYLCSGNVEVIHDVVGSAAALDVYAFLSIKLSDDRTLLEHLEEASIEARQLLRVDEDTFQQWRTAFLQIKKISNEVKTHTYVKQVYFPVGDNYHLLSILSPSGLMTEIRERIRGIKFSEVTQKARETRGKNQFHECGFIDILGLLTQNFGGTKPQNISKLNSNNNGEAWLLSCIPPKVSSQSSPMPRLDFFRSLHWDQYLRDMFEALHTLFVDDHNNINIRTKMVEQLFEWILSRAYHLQKKPSGWSDGDGFRLPFEQKLWLDAAYLEKRADHGDWRQDIALHISEWIVTAYTRFRKSQSGAFQLGKTELITFQTEILEYGFQNKEFLQ